MMTEKTEMRNGLSCTLQVGISQVKFDTPIAFMKVNGVISTRKVDSVRSFSVIVFLFSSSSVPGKVMRSGNSGL